MATAKQAPSGTSSDLHGTDLGGASKLVISAVLQVTHLVEQMHRNIARVSPIVGKSPTGRARGISGLVYSSVRGITQLVGLGLDIALARLSRGLDDGDSSPRREAVLAVLNGVLGDYLEATKNPLAITMALRQQGQPLKLQKRLAEQPPAGSPVGSSSGFASKLLVWVHGLCMNDLEWRRQDHEHGHGTLLAEELGYTPIYLHYNSGQHISTNGGQFATLLEELVEQWPVPVSEIAIVGHSMGGLVSRSACHYAAQMNLEWRHQLTHLICLGTPHHGAPLERAGSWLQMIVGISPYTAPFVGLTEIRSAGIQDLRYGNTLDEDWQGGGNERLRDPRMPICSGEEVPLFVIAATQATEEPRSRGVKKLPGDGLVPVESALGEHQDERLALSIPASRQSVCYGLNHLELLGSREVFEQLQNFLSAR